VISTSASAALARRTRPLSAGWCRSATVRKNFETLPSNQLELALWLEPDRMECDSCRAARIGGDAGILTSASTRLDC
jgi:hypothetical protein